MFQQAKIIHKGTHIVIKNALSKEICHFLTDYTNFKAHLKPNIRNNSDPLAGIHREYGDTLMETLLLKFTPLIEQATGLELWPTLSFYYTYKTGNQLKPHKDRSSCEYVAGLCIGADDTAQPWPLMLKIKGTDEELALEAGDMVIFKGHETEHWRTPFTGKWFISAIFAYVDKQGPFAFQKFDQRKSLGKAHVGMFNWTYGCWKHKILNAIWRHKA